MYEIRLAAILLPLLLTVACAKANVTKLPGGSHRIVCERGMKLCVSRADKLCGDDGYTIVSGTTRKHLLGGSSSSYREMAESAELVVSCGTAPPPPVQTEPAYVALPPRTDEPVALSPSSACVPGASQLCVGPAACQGGQVCLADGSGFAPCDCGSAAPAPAPAAAPATPAPSSGSGPPAPAPAPPPAKPVPGAMPPADPL